jgi:hypothetical protein
MLFMLTVVKNIYAKCHYAECRYIECCCLNLYKKNLFYQLKKISRAFSECVLQRRLVSLS